MCVGPREVLRPFRMALGVKGDGRELAEHLGAGFVLVIQRAVDQKGLINGNC